MSVLREWLHVWVWYWRHVTHRFARIDAYRLRGWLPDSCVCIDLGAHAGMWSVQLSRLVPHGQVVAFEALPYHARVLRRTLWLLGCRNVEVVNLAICDQAKSINLVWKNAHGKRLTGLTHILGQGETNSSTVTVQGTTLDEYFSTRPGRIRFVKMDIEGAEFAALQGAQQLFSQHRPIVYTELRASHCARYGYVPADVFQFFNSRNYRGYIPGPDDALEFVDAAQYIESKLQDIWFVPEEEVTNFLNSQASVADARPAGIAQNS